MKRSRFFLTLTFLVLGAASMNAQVTIGSAEDPHSGAILDLSKTGGNSFGFLLPRVPLENVNTWQISGTSDNGSGMVVYNTNNTVTGGNGIGIYVWNGVAWMPLKSDGNDVCPRIVKDFEDKTYYTGWFGDAGCWMTQNLRSTAGLTAEVCKESDTSLKLYWYPGNNSSISSYGLFYTWAAATNRTGISIDEANLSTQTPVQGICPAGWHLPSDYEWSVLEKEIASNPANYSDQTTPYANASSYDYFNTMSSRPSSSNQDDTFWGHQMKSKTVVDPLDPLNVPGTSNSFSANGFDVLMVGNVDGGIVMPIRFPAFYWSSSSAGDSQAWYRSFSPGRYSVGRMPWSKISMFSVRCKKN
jgi:uncharacterized protein (TIGR02145 family)